jgi:hypothetical protein
MDDYYFLAFVFLAGAAVGIIGLSLIEWVTDNYSPKKKVSNKVKAVQPQVEVYGKNYKKINNASKFDRVG